MRSFDPEAFLAVRETVLAHEREQKGIGTLGEKTLHRILKCYYEPLSDLHEQKLGRYVADILNEDGVLEIQTRQLSAMKQKLSAFLEVTPVTIIHPVVHRKWLQWLDPETGELLNKRRSPKTGTLYDAFWELGGIHTFLQHPNLTICLVMLDMEETRLLNGWSKDKKRGSTREDGVPVAILSETFLHTREDYAALLPPDLSEIFVTSELVSALGQKKDRAYTLVRVFRAAGVIEDCGKRGRQNQYRRLL